MQLEQLDNVDSNVLIEEDQKSVSYESKKVHFEGNAINFFDKTNKKKRKEILTRQSISNNARNNFFFLISISQSNRRMTGRVNAYILIWRREIK